MRAFNPFEWLVGIHPRLQVSAAGLQKAVLQLEEQRIWPSLAIAVITMSSRECEQAHPIRSEEWSAAVGRRKTEDGTILGKNGAFRLDYNTRHGEDTNRDEGTNYIPWRLMKLLTHLYEVHMDSVVLATGPTLDKTLLSWSAISAGFFAMSTTLPNQ